MTDEEIRRRLTEVMTSLDPEAEYDWRHEDFVAYMPQSRERVVGRGNMRELQRAFPPESLPRFTVRRVAGGGDLWTVEATGDYGGRIFHVVMVVELRDDRIWRETRYYAEPFEAPEWRAQWVEKMIEEGGSG